MKRTHHFSLFIITVMLTMLLLPFFVKAQVTLTVDGKPFEYKTMVVNITTVPEPPPTPEPPPPEPPPEPPPPAGDCGATLPQGRVASWLSVFKKEFPGPVSWQERLSIPRNSYYAIKFNTGNVNDSGKILNFEATSTVGSRLIAISRCEGDFASVEPECRVRVGTYAKGIPWSTRDRNGYCVLSKNTNYYWNTTFTDGVDPNTSKCTGTYCLTNNRATNRF